MPNTNLIVRRLSATALLLGLFAGSAAAQRLGSEIGGRLYGTWCLNTTEFEGEVTVDASIWHFRADGTYTYKPPSYESTAKFTLSGDRLELAELGEMKILEIDDEKMLATLAYSTYHFTKDECLPIVEETLTTTRLNNAIFLGDLELVKEMVAAGADVSRRDLWGRPPLIAAILRDNVELVRYLLSLEPDLSVTDSLDRTALEVARKEGARRIVRLLEGVGESSGATPEADPP